MSTPSDAHAKRQQALILLQEAQAIDGLKPWLFTHTKSNGLHDDYLIWADKPPSYQAVINAKHVINGKFGDGDDISVGLLGSLDELVGISPKVRISQNEQPVSINCYVQVEGDASHHDDEGVEGFYCVEVRLARQVNTDLLPQSEETAIAKAVLDEFHVHQGIKVLDDFDITVRLADGREIYEHDHLGHSSDIVLSVDYCGQINDSDVPLSIAAEQAVSNQPQQR